MGDRERYQPKVIGTPQIPEPVVVLGRDSTLLEIRVLVLQHGGLKSVYRLIDTPELLELPDTRLVVLCSSLGVTDQNKVAAQIKERLPRTDVLLIQTHPGIPSQYPPGVHVCGTAPEEIVAMCRKLALAVPAN
ncbi:MAG: hypothetical protein NVSMB62_24760 [Acidobacteriaceae bacterium]